MMELRSERLSSAAPSDAESRSRAGSVARDGTTFEVRKSSISTVQTNLSAWNDGRRSPPDKPGSPHRQSSFTEGSAHRSPQTAINLSKLSGKGESSMSTIQRLASFLGADKAESAKDVVWNFMESPSTSPGAWIWSVIMLMLILASSSAFVVETMPHLCCGRYDHIWNPLETVCITFFTIEYVCRFLACPLTFGLAGDELRKIELIAVSVEHHEKDRMSMDWFGLAFRARLRFLTATLNLIDLVAIVPFYIALLPLDSDSGGLSFMRVIRLVRVFRLLKFGKYSEGLQLLGNTLIKSLKPMGMLGFFLGIAVVLFSSLLYFAERGTFCDESNNFCAGTAVKGYGWYAVPGTYKGATYTVGCTSTTVGWCRDKSDMESIFIAMYWTLSTMTTTGYGDLVPQTPVGMIAACLVTMCGLLLLALPITVISGNFATEYAILEYNKYAAENRRLDERRESFRTTDMDLDQELNQQMGSELMINSHNTSDSNPSGSQAVLPVPSPIDATKQNRTVVTVNRSLLAPPNAEPPAPPTPTSAPMTPKAATPMSKGGTKWDQDTSPNCLTPAQSQESQPRDGSALAGTEASPVMRPHERSAVGTPLAESRKLEAISDTSPTHSSEAPTPSPSKKIHRLKPLPAVVGSDQHKKSGNNRINPLAACSDYQESGSPANKMANVAGQKFGYDHSWDEGDSAEEWQGFETAWAGGLEVSDEEIIGIVMANISGEGFGYGGNAAATARARRASIESSTPLVPSPAQQEQHPWKLSELSGEGSEGSASSLVARSLQKMLETHKKEVFDGIANLLQDSTVDIVKHVMEEQGMEFYPAGSTLAAKANEGADESTSVAVSSSSSS